MKIRVISGLPWSRAEKLELTSTELIFPDVRYQLADITGVKIKSTRPKALRILEIPLNLIASATFVFWFLAGIYYYLAIPLFAPTEGATQTQLRTLTPEEIDKYWQDWHNSSNFLTSYIFTFRSPALEIAAGLAVWYIFSYLVSPLIARKKIVVFTKNGETVVTDYGLAPHPIFIVYSWMHRLPLWVKKRIKKLSRAQRQFSPPV
jgi:hypothetical protein